MLQKSPVIKYFASQRSSSFRNTDLPWIQHFASFNSVKVTGLLSSTLCHLVDFKESFLFGLCKDISNKMPGHHRHWSLVCYIDFALLLSGSAFTVGIADDKPCHPPVSATPKSLHVMSSIVTIMPEPPHPKPVNQRSAKVMPAKPAKLKPAQVMSTKPQPSHAKPAKPKPAQVMSTKAQPAHVTSSAPRPAHVTSKPHHVSADPLEPHRVSADPLEPCHVSADPPEPRHTQLTPQSLITYQLTPYKPRQVFSRPSKALPGCIQKLPDSRQDRFRCGNAVRVWLPLHAGLCVCMFMIVCVFDTVLLQLLLILFGLTLVGLTFCLADGLLATWIYFTVRLVYVGTAGNSRLTACCEPSHPLIPHLSDLLAVVLANAASLFSGFSMAITNKSNALALALFLFLFIAIGLPSYMELGYLPCELRALDGHLRLDSVTYEHCRSLGIIRRPRYIHRSVRRTFYIQQPKPSLIPCIWTRNRTLVKSKRLPRDCYSSLVYVKKSASTGNFAGNTGQMHHHFALLNCRSISDKGPYLNELITDIDLDMLFLTETWQTPNDFIQLNLLTPNGYHYLSTPRLSGKGGGLAVICRDSITLTRMDFHCTNTFEYMAMRAGSNCPITVILIYRPPKQQNHFFSELSELLTLACASSTQVILLGDFNIHVDTPCFNSTQLKAVLDCFDLNQNVNFPTHTRGHTLDLVCTSGLNNISISGLATAISDHKLITFDFTSTYPMKCTVNKTISYRKLSTINIDALTTSIASSAVSDVFNFTCPSKIYDLYHSAIADVFDELAPTITRSVPMSRSAPWYNKELRAMKAKGRQLERLFRKTGLTVHYLAFSDHVKHYKIALNTAHSSYISKTISTTINKPKSLFSMVNRLVQPPTQNAFLQESDDLCCSFLHYFQGKLDAVCGTFDAELTISTCKLAQSIQTLNSFSLTNPTLIKEIIQKSNSSSCQVDPAPTFLLKHCSSAISGSISHLVNMSLISATVPVLLKTAAITPILKKPTLDPGDFANYRPISNLPFVSKVMEKVVATQLQSFLTRNKHFEKFQSGFRSLHSTETALVRVINDLLLSCDSGNLSILLLLDLSSAFDTVSHKLLLMRLSEIGISGAALAWLSSYLMDRQYYITMHNHKSPIVPLKLGVPQGSVLGPLLFIIYIMPLGQIIRNYGFQYHCYADDIQIYTSCRPDSIHQTAALASCVDELKAWLSSNSLSLNLTKTEILIVGPPTVTKNITNPPRIDLEATSILPSATVKNLGIILDSSLNLDAYISKLSKAAFFQLRRIAKLRTFMSPKDAESLVHAFITSRLDYCNALFFWITSTLYLPFATYSKFCCKNVNIHQTV
ncbi:hypothetical protein M9458_051301 [Cirrhinus mrigala]|uniref:Reverse transcriptase domain-containing protein n=1 Tax=Cirrhinus mrigala TaxID=683832 RepID=A0ABD0MW26_CIRMR